MSAAAPLVVGRSATGHTTHAGHDTGYALCGVLLAVETSTPFGAGPGGIIPAGSTQPAFGTCVRCWKKARARA